MDVSFVLSSIHLLPYETWKFETAIEDASKPLGSQLFRVLSLPAVHLESRHQVPLHVAFDNAKGEAHVPLLQDLLQPWFAKSVFVEDCIWPKLTACDQVITHLQRQSW